MAPERDRFVLSEGSRYGIVLVLLFGAIIVTIVGSPGTFSSLLTATFQGASVLVAIGGPAGRRGRRLLLLAGVVASITVTGLATGWVESGIRDFLNAGVIAGLLVIIVARYRRFLSVNLQTVLGAICVYLAIGMLFASFDAGLSDLSRRPFFTQAANVTRSQYMYFSFITLTTVGYGDLTPGSGAARALAVSEALTGQLYLVTVVALLVASFSRSRQQPPLSDS